MKLTRVRFTVRRMMVAVFVIGVVTALVIRGERRRVYYREAAYVYWASSMKPGNRTPEPERSLNKRLWIKYEWAARLPWIPIWPFPPEGAMLPK